MEFGIETTWRGEAVRHAPVKLCFSPGDGGLKMEVSALFFGDPPAPPGPVGRSFPGLWDYEVVESFFLNKRTGCYLEVELCPHGQHLVLLLDGKRNVLAQGLPLEFTAQVQGAEWKGEALLPWNFFPPGVDSMNSYAIQGSGAARSYEALYPVPPEDVCPGQGPDFHRLEYFRTFRLQDVMGEGWVQPDADLWRERSGFGTRL